MPELPEVHRAERACNENVVGKKIVQIETKEDNLVFGNTTNKEFENNLLNKIVINTGRWGKYFYFEMNEGPNPVFHFGMTGDICFKGQKKFSYRSRSSNDDDDDDSNEWPPKFWKFILTFEDTSNESNESNEKIMMAFSDVRRLARINFTKNSPLKDPPISELGFDPLKNMPNIQKFSELILKRKCPIKALLLDQQFSAGVGNWISDEVLFQSHIHPSQNANTLSKEQINELHEKLVYVCKTAVDLNAESRLFPDTWLFHHRWNKGNKNKSFMSNGEEIIFRTVGGRTTAIVPSVQKLPGGNTESRQKRKTTTEKAQTSNEQEDISQKRRKVDDLKEKSSAKPSAKKSAKTSAKRVRKKMK